MKRAGFALAAIVAVAAALVIFLALANDTSAPADVPSPTPTPMHAAQPSPTPLPRTWLDGFRPPSGGAPLLISCGDTNGDGLLTSADRPELGRTVIALAAGEACNDPSRHADYYASPGLLSCGAGAIIRLVLVPSAGSDLLDASSGESLGLIDIANTLRREMEQRSVPSELTIAASALFGSDPPQTSMERWLAAQASAELAARPCLRIVLIGHSHGGATVTSATAALDAAYGNRMLAVLIDRTTALYDRQATEMPVRTPILNFFQTNEGWHGIALDLPNAVNFDESGERAPVAPSDGGGGFALVSHKTLDDSPGVQSRAADAVMSWIIVP